MLKSELFDQLIKKLPHIKNETIKEASNHLLATISDTLIRGERIEIRGFGCFSVRHNPARTATNFKTMKRFTTQAKYKIRFKAGKKLREKINTIKDK